MKTLAAALVLGLALAGGASGSRQAPPPNDNRATPQLIASFPATIDGTTVESTVERLDPQRSQCGTVEGTVWYRINQAPDGTIVLSVRGPGLTPVIRVYPLQGNSLQELTCASAKKGAAAKVTFEPQRGHAYLILVGRKPKTADANFVLDAQLFLPPANDTASEAQPIKLPATVKATTLGATTDDSDPEDCGLRRGTVWYRVNPGSASRVVVRLRAEGNLDASIVVRRKVRSETDSIACSPTDAKGAAVVGWDVQPKATYLVAVGQRGDSPPGDFTLQALGAQAREKAPGQHLPAGGTAASVNILTDINDIWWTELTPGTTYRISFDSPGCARLTLTARTGLLASMTCHGYTSFTPGPDAAGRFVFQITAPVKTGSIGYRLRIAPAGADDIGIGLHLPNLSHVRGALAPSGVDVVDVYNFDVDKLSDVRVHMTHSPRRDFTILLLSDTGRRIETSESLIRRRLGRGHFLVAVRGAIGSRAGAYNLSLIVRQVTVTRIGASARTLVPGDPVTFTVGVTPASNGGAFRLQIDRFDPLTGWQFNRTFRVQAPTGTVTWTPPAQGRWRARARFLGTATYSPSRSGYVHLLVARPIG